MKTMKMKFAMAAGIILLTVSVIYTIAYEPTIPYQQSTGFVREWLAAFSR
ncbi:MAG: hypothetical protein PF588_06080 [Candidatus Kapabacteria bacterium]|jgi:hypothetical protein|nr:hypothetical protein [Candidatus Kapabacteria bacterium]